MSVARRIACLWTLVAACHWFPVSLLLVLVHVPMAGAVSLVLLAALLWGFLWVNLRPLPDGAAPTKRIGQLACGCELLTLFWMSATVNLVFVTVETLWLLPMEPAELGAWLSGILIAVAVEAVVFWNGMIRVYLTSLQLGLKHRVLAALCGWIPLVNIWYLRKIIRIVSDEVEFETEKWELDEIRAENEICRTKYPILMVHGVFFRDYRYINYWGRIPRELQRNGATVYYGCQQSAAAVEESGKELAERIRRIVEESGCEKVNIIAHSKGGLDSRCAISCLDVAPMVASLTTINTPHRGCIFAEKLLALTPDAFQQKLADFYNGTLKKLGDKNPDFLAAVRDLTASACEKFNRHAQDVPGVLYESVGSYVKKAAGGRFPLNVSYELVRHYDGPNDGLVAVEAARWGSRFTLLEPRGRRGISHADVIDLGRENIRGFDVREFYVKLVHDLQKRGY